MSASRNERRTDILTGRQVIVAPDRGRRPIRVAPAPVLSQDAQDPFLEGNEQHTPDERLVLRRSGSTPNGPGWLVRAVSNRYPAVSNNPGTLYGTHDVVIECPDHRSRLAELSSEELARVFFAWQQRIRQMAADPAIKCVSVFRNEGRKAGASLPHCHSQIIATDFAGSQLQQRIQCSETAARQNRPSPFESWLRAENDKQTGIVHRTDAFIIVCPDAGRVDWHTRFVPATGELSEFESLSREHLAQLAQHVLSVVRTLDEIVGATDHNLILILPPVGSAGLFPWMLDFLPRQNQLAGFELLSDTDILTIKPEAAAEQLRRNAVPAAAADVAKAFYPDGYEWISGR